MPVISKLHGTKIAELIEDIVNMYCPRPMLLAWFPLQFLWYYLATCLLLHWENILTLMLKL